MRKYAGFAQLSAEERAVGRRFRLVRTRLRISQKVFAPLAASSRDQVSNVELGRRSLRFTPGWNFCATFNINPLWLALGELPIEGFADFNTSEILDEEPFRTAIAARADWYRNWRSQQLAAPKSPYARPIATLTEWLPRSSVEQRRRFVEKLERITAEIESGRKENIGRRFKFNLNPPKAVRNWQELRRKLIKATAKLPGAKSEIARRYGVTPAAVSQWLSGKSSPPSDVALELQHFVGGLLKRRKKNRGARASEARAPHKTRKGNLTANEKAAKSDRKAR